MKQKRRILLHSCCGPCSTAVLERLLEEYAVTLFFSNSNITDKEEYEKRKNTQLQFLESFNQQHGPEEQITFCEGSYQPEHFFELCEGLEEESEGGARCPVCFRMRLEETAQKAKQDNFELFGTTLSVSPHKNYGQIREIGEDLEEKTGVLFLKDDFKKKAGFQRSIELSKQYGLYRQNYCGCEFSEKQAELFRREREGKDLDKLEEEK